MFDCHYDLLTYIYMNKDNLDEVKVHCKKIFKDSITGGIFNLFYMSPKEMDEELGIKKEEINIIQNLRVVNKLIKENNIIPNNVKYIYGIEGLDYLEKLEDLDEIYNLGVRSTNIVWNNDNKFGGGAKGDKNRGLTELGRKLVQKLVDKKIAIDLSHSNEKTFYDIIGLCKELKENGKRPIVFASHSNVKNICNHIRNLNDDQLLQIKKLDGVIGIVTAKPFCVGVAPLGDPQYTLKNEKTKYQNAYIEHIKYIKKLFGNVDNIAVSTDDMTYYKTKKDYYKYFNAFKQDEMKYELEKLLLQNDFTKEEVENILYKNFDNKILQKL